MEFQTTKGKVRESPADACLRRWKRLKPAARERYIMEARAVIAAGEEQQ